MRIGIHIHRNSVRLAVVLTLVVMSAFASVITVAQSTNPKGGSTSARASLAFDRVANSVVFESEALTVRRITLSPNSTGYQLRHPGGSIILLGEYSYKLTIPISVELEAGLKVGDVIPVPPGDYVLDNPTTKPLDFLSIEMKH